MVGHAFSFCFLLDEVVGLLLLFAGWNLLIKSGVHWSKSRFGVLGRALCVVKYILRTAMQEGRNLYCRVEEVEYFGNLS